MVKDLVAKFTEVERRVRKLVEENSRLRGQVRELEQQLADAQRDARDLEMLQGKRAQVRQKLERVLKALEALAEEERDRETKAAQHGS